MPYEDYQEPLTEQLVGLEGRFKALVLPTGSGKTRIALAFAQDRIEQGRSAAYIVESDLHARQVQREAEAEGIDVAFIPGLHRVRGNAAKEQERTEAIEEYRYAETIGLFSYAGYFHGSAVPRATVLVVDDAHALPAEQYNYSCIRITEEHWGAQTVQRLRSVIGEAVPAIRHLYQDLVEPVHRGGRAILVPPVGDEAADLLKRLVEEASQGEGFPRFLLRERMAASPRFTSWPLVVTKDTVAWQPFILPFESLGQPLGPTTGEREVLLVTATKGPNGFLQSRLGVDEEIAFVEDPEVPQMGHRLVVPLPDTGAAYRDSIQIAKFIERLTKEFGTIVVTSTSTSRANGIIDALPGEFNVVISRSDSEQDPVPSLDEKNEPRVLFLINRPSGVDIPSTICSIGVHLDLPYANDGHGVLAGAGGDAGRSIHASLAVRMSQLLGRLNRSETDRSVHILLGADLPIEQRGLFARTLEPAVLKDILAGQIALRGLDPGDEGDIASMIADFLDGKEVVSDAMMEKASRRARVTVGTEDEGNTSISIQRHVEANSDLALGNWIRAFKGYWKLSLEARQANRGDSAVFLALQALCALDASAEPAANLCPPDGRASLLKAAREAKIANPTLLTALDAASQADEVVSDNHEQRRRMRNSAINFYARVITDEDLGFPVGDAVTSEESWAQYWQEAFTEHEHDVLQHHVDRAFRLLGSSTPKSSKGRNDLIVRWDRAPQGQGIAVEVKGRKRPDGGDESAVQDENVSQAADNALGFREEVDVALLLTSKTKCPEPVREKASERDVRIMRHDDLMSFSRPLARHCAKLARIHGRQLGPSELDFLFVDVYEQLNKTPGGQAPGFA